MALTRAECEQSRRSGATDVRYWLTEPSLPLPLRRRRRRRRTPARPVDQSANRATPSLREPLRARARKPAAHLASDESTEAPDLHMSSRRRAGGSSLALEIRVARGGRHDHANPTQ